MTKKTKVYNEVENIINSNMKLKEKMNALEAINFEGRPGCKEALELSHTWKSRVRGLQEKLHDNLHSADFTGGDLWINRRRPSRIQRIIDICEKHGFREFANRMRDADVPVEISFFDNDRELANFRFGFGVSAKTSYRLRSAYGRLYGKNIASLMTEYKTDILPVIRERKAIEDKHQKENQDWQHNFGIVKWRGVILDMPAYVTSPLTADKNNTVVMFPYAFKPIEDVEEDWEYYSKAWHQAHGPKRTITGREVRVYQYGKGRIRTIELPKWKPGFMVEVVAQVLGLQQPKVDKSLRKFQVSPWVNVKRSVKRNGIQFYNLTMGKYTVGVVAYDEQRGIHYHADTKEAAIAGLNDKIAKMEAEEKRAAMEANAVLTANLAHNRWGFCWPGMTEFANAIGFDLNGSYTVAQLREAVRGLKDRRIICKYRRELETAKIINF